MCERAKAALLLAILVGSSAVCSSGPAQAFTCADVRALSHEQQAYYIRAYNITPAQQRRIRFACYGASGRGSA
jgi:hypothetical protein